MTIPAVQSRVQFNGWVAQLAEQWTENPRVGGSIPPPAIPMRKPGVQQILQQDRPPGFINFSRDRIGKGALMALVNACRALARQALRACQRAIIDRMEALRFSAVLDWRRLLLHCRLSRQPGQRGRRRPRPARQIPAQNLKLLGVPRSVHFQRGHVTDCGLR